MRPHVARDPGDKVDRLVRAGPAVLEDPLCGVVTQPPLAALVPQLVTRALPAGVTVLELRDEQAPYRRVVAITDARRQPSELTRMFIRLAKQAATRPS